jgi:hypothetical protein
MTDPPRIPWAQVSVNAVVEAKGGTLWVVEEVNPVTGAITILHPETGARDTKVPPPEAMARVVQQPQSLRKTIEGIQQVMPGAEVLESTATGQLPEVPAWDALTRGAQLAHLALCHRYDWTQLPPGESTAPAILKAQHAKDHRESDHGLSVRPHQHRKRTVT